MKLKELFSKLNLDTEENIDINRIVTDSRTIQENDLFIAFKGSLYNGNDYINEVINKGCRVILSQEKQGKYIHKVKNIINLKNKITEILYNDIINETFFIAVTGTNGKTTTSYIIYKLLKDQENINVILVGTNGIYYKDVHQELDNTTPDELIIFNFIKDNINNSLKTYVIMEVSSHSLSLNRIDHINFDIAIYLNLSHEHLDYYQTMDKYSNAKSLLFTKLKNKKIAIINIDDNYAYKMLNLNNKNICFGKNIATNKITLKESNLENLSFTIDNSEYKTKIIGNYNIYNLASAILCLKEIGISDEIIKEKLIKLDNIEGRMEIHTYQHKNIVIDFAHTPQAMKKALMFLRTQTSNKIITLFGCGGNRDKEKRPKMMEIASLYSDEVYLTSDNPRFEDPLEIMKDCLMGIKNDRVHLYIDRRLAIYNALKNLNKDEYLVILGKGHEKEQIVLDNKIRFNDLEEVEKWMRKQV